MSHKSTRWEYEADRAADETELVEGQAPPGPERSKEGDMEGFRQEGHSSVDDIRREAPAHHEPEADRSDRENEASHIEAGARHLG